MIFNFVSNPVDEINICMKYQTITICSNSITSAKTNTCTVGWDRFNVTPQWEEFKTLRDTAINNGDLDRYWGPFDAVEEETDNHSRQTTTYNTLTGAENYYNLMVDANSNNPTAPDVFYCKVVEINDDGTFVRLVKESTDLTPR